MAQLLQHQDSSLYRNDFHGCRWSLLQFFGLRRRLRSTKMLSDKKHSQRKSSSGGSKLRGSYVPLEDEDSGILDNEKNIQVAKKHKTSKKNSGKASLRTLILRKLYGKQGQKEKMLPVAPKLLRTISIHYLESDDYVLHSDSSSVSPKPSMQNGIDSSLQHAIYTEDGRGTDTSSLLLLNKDSKNSESHLKIRKSHRSISMDGVLHKVPYGHKVSEDVTKEQLLRSASVAYDRDGWKPSIATTAKSHANRSIQRSRSLTESLERYSHLIDSNSSRESKTMLRGSKSTRDHSYPDIRSKSLARNDQASQSNILEETSVAGDVKIAMDGNSSDVVIGVTENPVSIEESNSTESGSCAVPLASEEAEIPEYATTCDDDQVQSCQVPDSIEGTPSEEVGTEKGLISREKETGSPMSVIDIVFADDSASPAKHTVLEDLKLKLITAHSNVEDVSANIHVPDADISTEPSNTSSVCGNEELSGFADLNALIIEEDQKNEAKFSYVKDIFEKSNFSNERLFEEWYFKNIAALQEEDCQHYEVGISALDFTEMSADQLLLFDLTNEALLDIYKKSSFRRSIYSRFTSFDRPKPIGRHVLKELWSKVSCHLASQSESDKILANDLANGDGWVNFQSDADRLGNELADFVCDKLLTEFILQMAKF